MTTISTRQSTDELVTRILGEERKRKAPADKRTPPSDQSLHSWDAPDWSILDDRRGELPDFPLDCLSPPVREWVERAARGAGVTPAHVAVPALGIASSLIGMARRAKASKSWTQPMTCWTAVVGASGTGKTPGIDTVKRALAQVDRDNRSKIADLQRKHEEKAGLAKATRTKWNKEVEEAIAANRTPPPMPPEAMELGKFVAPQLYVSNATVERLGELLQARPQGMLQLMDELAALFMNMSRYSGGQDNEFWLETWNGGSYNVQRVGRPPLHIDHLMIGLVGGMQPDKLAASFEGDHDGMYARFLFAWPQEPAYRALADEADEFDPDIINLITRLDRLAEFEDGNLVKRSIELSAEARTEFEQFRQFVHREREALDGRELEWMAKAPAHALRLAGMLCLLDWASGQSPSPPATIDLVYMRAAIKLVRDYFWPHARAALRQIGLSERHVNARRALRWIRARHQAEVSLKDIRRDALGQKLDAEETANLLAAMERSGWVRKKEVKTEGRSAWRWEVNPKLHPDARSAGSAERSRSASLSAEEWASCTSCTSCKPYRDQWRRRAREGEDMEEHARAVGVSQRTRDQQVASPEADPGDIPESPRRCAYCGQTSTAADPLHHGHWRPRKPDGDWLHTRCKDPWQAGGWRLK